MVDPINYDVDELRALAAATGEAARTEVYGFRWVTPPPMAREPTRDEGFLSLEQRRRLLLLHGVSFDPADATPVLSTLPTDSPALVFAWLEFLVTIVGTDGTRMALARYQEVGWLTAAVRETLHEYLAWIAPRDGDDCAAMDQADHLLSFAYVAALAARHGTERVADVDG